MTDGTTDFRYTIGDETVEGYQITESSRYQEKLWPEWLDSRAFLTIDGQNWIVINGEEVRIPELAWIVKHGDGRMSIVDAFEFENAVKVVPNPPLAEIAVFPIVDKDKAYDIQPAIEDELLIEVQGVFAMLKMGAHEDAIKALRGTLSSRVNWCTCSPGQCEKLEPWGCREQSPLVKES